MSVASGRAPTLRPVVRAFAALLGLSGVAGSTPGCGRGGTHEVTEVRERTDDDPPAPEATIAQRFQPDRRMGGGDPHAGLAGGPGANPAPSWSWKTPEGWKELGPAPMRVTAWRVADDAECSFSTLPAAGGGLAANVDRWRKQMSLPPEGEAGVATLPRHPMLGRDAVRVELEGAFVSMSGDKHVPGAKLLGLVVEMPASTAFLKLTGPAAVVDAHAARFLALAGSIAPASQSGVGGSSSAAGGPDTTLSPFGWSAPPTWVRQPARTMRLATFVPAGASTTEVYVALLTGRAGGARANLDRWRGQMGAAPLSDAEFDALARTPLLGGTAIFLTTDGSYTGMAGAGSTDAAAGMTGAEAGGGQRLLGMALERPKDMVFVKMTGPADEVRAEEGRFRAFCESFHD